MPLRGLRPTAAARVSRMISRDDGWEEGEALQQAVFTPPPVTTAEEAAAAATDLSSFEASTAADNAASAAARLSLVVLQDEEELEKLGGVSVQAQWAEAVGYNRGFTVDDLGVGFTDLVGNDHGYGYVNGGGVGREAGDEGLSGSDDDTGDDESGSSDEDDSEDGSDVDSLGSDEYEEDEDEGGDDVEENKQESRDVTNDAPRSSPESVLSWKKEEKEEGFCRGSNTGNNAGRDLLSANKTTQQQAPQHWASLEGRCTSSKKTNTAAAMKPAVNSLAPPLTHCHQGNPHRSSGSTESHSSPRPSPLACIIPARHLREFVEVSVPLHCQSRAPDQPGLNEGAEKRENGL